MEENREGGLLWREGDVETEGNAQTCLRRKKKKRELQLEREGQHFFEYPEGISNRREPEEGKCRRFKVVGVTK